MKSKIKKIIEDWPRLWRSRNAVKHPYIVEFLNLEYPNVPINLQIDALINNRSPYCVVCNKPVKTIGKVCCSTECRDTHGQTTAHLRVQKQKETLVSKYGVDNIRSIPGAIEKRNNTMIERYGGKTSELSRQLARDRSPMLNEKSKSTLAVRYNVLNSGQIPGHREKCKNTMLANYGVDTYFLSDEFLSKSKNKRDQKWQLFLPESIQFDEIQDASLDKKLKSENPNRRIKFKCNTCNSIETLPTETVKWRIRETGTCCNKCGGIKQGSLAQAQLTEFINSLGIVTIANDRNILNGKEIDILIPSHNIGIEYNGLFWHNDLRIDKNYHKNKSVAAMNMGIRLIHIFEDEWVHHKEIVKSRISYLLGTVNTKIFARKCKLREVNTNLEKEFLENNHIQGYAPSSIKIGLFFNDELVSLMTFSHPNQSKGQKQKLGTWELLRFCNKIDTTVLGGATRLLSYFKKQYNPSTIMSFADKRWSDGNLYKTLNFSQCDDTSLNYWYINLKELKRIHRYSMRKNKHDDPALTEYENRLMQGFIRIWDCGSSKWKWNSHS